MFDVSFSEAVNGEDIFKKLRPNVLQKVNLPLVNNTVCNQWYKQASKKVCHCNHQEWEKFKMKPQRHYSSIAGSPSIIDCIISIFLDDSVIRDKFKKYITTTTGKSRDSHQL